MRKEIDDVREWGEPLATLYASEGAIYRHYGYGPASISGNIALPCANASFYATPPSAGRVRMVTVEEALELFPPIYDRVAAETAGMLSRTREWWETRKLATGPWMKGELFMVVLEIDGEPEGYAMYSIESEMEHMVSHSVLQVREAIGATPAATRDIWRFILDVDWIETVKAGFLPPDHPLFLLLTEPRRMAYRAIEALWCRLVDVGGALSARTYRDGEPVVLDVGDEFCPWNEGRWEVSVDGAEQTKATPDLRLGVDMLGSVYLGGFSFADLARAGRVEELRDWRARASGRPLRHRQAPVVPRDLLTPFDPATTGPDTRRMRLWLPALLVLAVLVTVTACGGAGKIKRDDVVSCMNDSGKFVGVKDGDHGQIRYAGTAGGVEGTYKAAQPVHVNVLLGKDSGEASNLSSNMQESGAWVDVTRVRNAVYAVPVADQSAPSRSEAGDATKSCLE